MAPSMKDQLIGQLVTKITGLENGTLEWNKAVQKTKYKLLYEKCTSTSEMEVNESYDGLVEKFGIKGHSELSKSLLEYKSEYLKKTRPIFNGDINQSILKYDLLRLILTLSTSSNQNYDYAPTLNINNTNANLTWEEVIQDDPLEGDHWKTWSDETVTDDELSDTEDFEFEETTKPSATKKQQVMPERVDYSNQMDIDTRADPEGLNYLLTQQYWRDDYKMASGDDGPILTHPNKLNQALGRLLYSERERQSFKAIPESGMIREVLGFLRGYSGILFQRSQNAFTMNKSYVVQHLSQQALRFILEEFYEYGIILFELRDTAIKHMDSHMHGQTSQAFSACIYKSLLEFNSTSLELDVMSILKLKTLLEPTLICFKAIHAIVKNISWNRPAREISAYLISSLYENALKAQQGHHKLYDTLLYILQETIQPYGRIMDDWVSHGSLQADKFNEFYVMRNQDVTMHDSNFWVQGFAIQSMDQSQYCYPCPLFGPQTVSHIFFTGKAINLLSHIENKKETSSDPQTFSDVMENNISKKPPFIQTVNTTTSMDEDEDENNAYVRALFPLANRPKKPHTVPPTAIYEDTINDLLDQQWTQCMDIYIQQPYQSIANELNRVLHQHCELDIQLKSLASIYLMLENDLMHTFCESIFSYMDQNEPWLDKRILNQVFTEACDTSGYHERAIIETAEINDSRSMTIASYLEYIQFKVDVSWPLNNFIQKEQLPNYSKVLSFLFRLKRAKYVMEKKTLFTRRSTMNSTVMHFYSLRMKILWFINAFWRYMMTTILHAETINFRDKLSLSKDADEITALHNSYIRRLVDRCLLNEKASSIRRSIMSILDMAETMRILFTTYLDDNQQDMEQLSEHLNTIEKDFQRTNEFITVSLMIMGKKAGLPWFESLATSLSAQ